MTLNQVWLLYQVSLNQVKLTLQKSVKIWDQRNLDTAQSVVQKSDINAPGKRPNVPGKKKLEFEYARFYAPLKVSEKNDSGTKRGLNRAYAPFSLEMKKIS